MTGFLVPPADPPAWSVLAQASPPTLVGVPSAADAGGTPGSGLWFVLMAGLAAVVCIALTLAALWAFRRLVVGRGRSARSSAVFVTMCRGMKLSAADQRLLKQLAQREGNVTPVTLVLCPSVFERAATKAGSTLDRDALHRLRQRLAA
ncbi:MAG: hypothetical protein JNM86_06085 [Phycisphaerae bacterium]|nr:hypothetical protein [Phycisphaerae bacterium]